MAVPTSSSIIPVKSVAQVSTPSSVPNWRTLVVWTSVKSPNRPCPYIDGLTGWSTSKTPPPVSVTAERGMLQVNRAVIVPFGCGRPSEPRSNWPPGW